MHLVDPERDEVGHHGREVLDRERGVAAAAQDEVARDLAAGRAAPAAGPVTESVVRQRYSGPSSDSAAAEVTIFTFDAAFMGAFSPRA